jgi:putative ABC transport system permease protein
MLSKEFTKWVLLASLIACPIGYLLMKKWLENFAYRVGIGIEIFVVSALIALIIAMLTVSYQSIKAAIANPVDSLKYE